MKYLKNFNTLLEYEDSIILSYPNVSYIINDRRVKYENNPKIPTKYIIYESVNDQLIDLSNTNLFGTPFVSNEYGTFGIIRFANPVKSIGQGSFRNASSLGSLIIPSSVQCIGSEAFMGCTSLTKIEIPESISAINSKTFAGCTSLNEVLLPDSIGQIYSQAFEGCTQLNEVVIPKNVRFIESGSFSGCNNLKYVALNSKYIVEDGDVYNSFNELFGPLVEQYTIKDGTRAIRYGAFKDCTGLSSVTIPKSVVSIGNQAFLNSGIYNNSENWENGMLYIDDCLVAYDGTSSVYLDLIKEGTRVIADNAFYNGYIYGDGLPQSVKHIGDYAFFGTGISGSIGLENVESIGSNAFYDSSLYRDTKNWENGILYFENCLLNAQNSLSGDLVVKDGTRLIAGYALRSTKITSVTLPDSVLYVGYCAFESNYNLTSINLGNGVVHIDDRAFMGCQMDSLTFPDSVRKIGKTLFDGCSHLKDVTIGKSVVDIDPATFQDCHSIENIYVDKDNPYYSSNNGILFDKSGKTLLRFPAREEIEYIVPDTTTAIGELAFEDRDKITFIKLPKNVASIGIKAFLYCNALTTIDIPDSVEVIGESAFSSCIKLESIVLPKSLTQIETGTFSGCRSLTSIVIPDNIRSIGKLAFSYCTGVESITIGSNVALISSDAFNGCLVYKDNFINNSPLDAEANNYWGATIFDLDINGVFIKDNSVLGSRSDITSAVIPSNITDIRSDAFSSRNSLTSVTINSDAIVRKDYSLYNTIADIFGSQVTEYIIGDDVKGIGLYAFKDCSSLTSVTIGNSVTSIGDDAFRDCRSLTSITIPDSVTSIGAGAFKGSGVYNASANWENGVLYINDCLIEAQQYVSDADIIKEGTRLIGDSAFYYCKSIPSINIPSSVTNIGWGAFNNCTKLTSVTIPNSVTSIGGSAFSYCSSLTSVSIPNSVTSIGYSAFNCCSSLTSANIPNSVTSIENQVFYNCSKLTSITIPNSITSIGNMAFDGCSSLTSVTIGENVTSIGDQAFYRCSSLKTITCEATTPPTLGSNNNLSSVTTVYVPADSVEAYKAATNWAYYANKIQPIQES